MSLTAMTEADENSNIYAAPVARPLAEPEGTFRSRFWWTSLLSGVVLPVVWTVFLVTSSSIWGGTLLLLACWVIPVISIFLPQIRQPGGFARITPGRFIAVSAAYLAVVLVVLCVLLIGFAYVGFLVFGAD